MDERLIKFVFLFVVLVGLLSMVSAITTLIEVKTLPYHTVEVTVSDGASSDYLLIERFEGESNYYGDVSFELETTKPKLNIYFFIKANEEKIVEDRTTYLEYPNTGEEIYIELAPEGAELVPTPDKNSTGEVLADEFISNETENNETIIEEVVESSGDEASITGATIMETVLSPRVLYSVGGVVVVLIVLFIILKILKHRRKSGIGGGIKVRKLSEVNQDPKGKIENKMQMIEDAERKIKEAQQEIGKLRNEEKIKELRKKLEDDQKELMKLGG